MRDDEPEFIHDTRRVISVNQAACELFRCDELALVDADLMELLPDDADRRWLVGLRLGQMRQNKMPPPFVHTFRRCDGSLFYASVVTDALGCGQFQTAVLYLAEKNNGL